MQFIPYLRFIVDLEMFELLKRKKSKAEGLNDVHKFGVGKWTNVDFPMPIVKTTYSYQYQWEKCNPFLILDVRLDKPNMEVLALFKDRSSQFSVPFHSRTRTMYIM